MKVYVLEQVYVYDSMNDITSHEVYGVYTSKKLAEDAIKNCPNYTSYEWNIDGHEIDVSRSMERL